MRKVSKAILLVLFFTVIYACSSSDDDRIFSETDSTEQNNKDNNSDNDSTKDAGRTDSIAQGDSVLIVYFSRTGYNYNGSTTNLKWTNPGNTAIMASYIQEYTHGRMFEIVAANPYPDDYMQTVAQNMEEERTNARPAIRYPLNVDMSHFRYVFVGSPVWNSQAPMIMHTFYETYRSQLRGKTMIAFGTHEMSGISGLERALRNDLGTNNDNTFLEGLGLIGRTIQSDESRQQVRTWVARILRLED